MARILIWLAAILVALAVVSQFALPPIAENRVADRLTANGGHADVSISAFPAVRLLFGEGDRIEVRGEGLTVPPSSSQTGAFEKLGGFEHVDIALRNVTVSPVTVRSFELRRDGSNPYTMRATAYTSLADLLNFGAARLGLLEGALLRFGAGEALGSSARNRIPIKLDMQLTDDGGRLVVVGGSGTIAGIPTGPLAELITSAITVQL